MKLQAGLFINASLLVLGMASSPALAQDEAAAPLPVRTLVVAEPRPTSARQFFGRVAARDTLDLAFEVGGELLVLAAIEGAAIAAGARIAELDLGPFERAVERAALTLLQAERDLERAQTLAERNVASAVNVENTQTARDIADIALRDARAALADARMVAPFDGLLKTANRDLDRSMSLTAMPKGFADHDGHRHADVIKLKSLMVREDLPKGAWTSGDIVERIEQLARDAMPLLSFVEPVS